MTTLILLKCNSFYSGLLQDKSLIRWNYLFFILRFLIPIAMFVNLFPLIKYCDSSWLSDLYSIWGGFACLEDDSFCYLLSLECFLPFFQVKMPITEYNKSVCCTLERISQLKISLGCSRPLIIYSEY